MYLTCSFRLCDCVSSFCWRVSSLASYCSRMAVMSLSCCSRARVSVSDRHRSIICSFMLSIATSATRCCFRLCVRTHFLSYKRLHHVLHHFNKLQMPNFTWTCCVTDVAHEEFMSSYLLLSVCERLDLFLQRSDSPLQLRFSLFRLLH